MNARQHVIDITCDARQVEESVSCLFHTILFHRCLGKFNFRDDGAGQQTIVIGSVGYDDVDCSTVDLTYVRCSSPTLRKVVSSEVKPFASALQHASSSSSAAISLEFYQKRPGGLLVMGQEKAPWEIWLIKFSLAHISTDAQRQRYRYDLAPVLSDKMLMIVDEMNRYEYVPKNPQREELDVVFDTRFPDVQPYLFRISRYISDLNPPTQSVSKAVAKVGRLLRDVLDN